MARILRRLETALSELAPRLPETGEAPPGSSAILRRMAEDPGVHSSVLTGNIAPNAATKLAAFGLDRRLDLEAGAYGSDDADRLMLVPAAMRRAAKLRGVGRGVSRRAAGVGLAAGSSAPLLRSAPLGSCEQIRPS